MPVFSNVSVLNTFLDWLNRYNQISTYLTGQVFTSSVSDTSTANIATANAVKTAYDTGVAAFARANSTNSQFTNVAFLSGANFTGQLSTTGLFIANSNMTVNGAIVTNGIISSANTITAAQNFVSSNGNAVLAANGASGTVFVRPNGAANVNAQVSILSNGMVVIPGRLGTQGSLNTADPFTSGGPITAAQNFVSSNTNAVLAPNGAGSVWLRPNGPASNTGQTFIAANGSMSVGGDLFVSGNTTYIGSQTITGNISAFRITGVAPGSLDWAMRGNSANGGIFGTLGYLNQYALFGKGTIYNSGALINDGELRANSSSNIGVSGISSASYGVVGRTLNVSFAGVSGYSANAGITGFIGYQNQYSFYGNGTLTNFGPMVINDDGSITGTLTVPKITANNTGSGYGISVVNNDTDYAIRARALNPTMGAVIGQARDPNIFAILGYSNTYSVYATGHMRLINGDFVQTGGNFTTGGDVTATLGVSGAFGSFVRPIGETGYGVTARSANTQWGGVIGLSANSGIFGILGYLNQYSFYGNGTLRNLGPATISGLITGDAMTTSGEVTFTGGGNIAWGTSQTSARLSNRLSIGSQFEFGISTTTGYGSTIGAESTSGYPFIAFHGESGTTANRYRTRGILPTIIRSDVAGGIRVATVSTANADNQLANDYFSITKDGLMIVGTSYQSEANGFTRFGSGTSAPIVTGTMVFATQAGLTGFAAKNENNSGEVFFGMSSPAAVIGSMTANNFHIRYNNSTKANAHSDGFVVTGNLDATATVSGVTGSFSGAVTALNANVTNNLIVTACVTTTQANVTGLLKTGTQFIGSGGQLGWLNSIGTDTQAAIGGATDGLRFYSASSQKAYISNTSMGVGATQQINIAAAEFGVTMGIDGTLQASKSAGFVGRFKRDATTGTMFEFFQNTSSVGTISVTASATAYNTSSDENLKNFVKFYDGNDAANVILADPVWCFSWKRTGDNAIGWGAQTSYNVSTDLATPGHGKPGDEDYQPWGIDQGKRTPYLWAAVTKLLKENKQMKEQIADINERLLALEVS